MRARPRELQVWRIHLALAAIAAYAVVSALLAHQLADNQAFFGLVDYLGLIPFALFWVAPFAFRTAWERNILLGCLAAVGLYLGVIAILETTGPHALVIPRYINDPHVGIHFGRARGPFVEAAGNGLSMYICIVASALALRLWSRRRWLPVLTIAVCSIGIVFTLTRQVWLGAVVSVLVTMLLQPGLRRWLIPTVVTGTAGVGRVHNIFLGYAAELGVFATLAWAAALLYVVVGGLRRRGPPDLDVWRIALLAIGLAWLVVANFTPMGYAFDHATLWLWAGITWSRT
jgi:hypothetical protein